MNRWFMPTAIIFLVLVALYFSGKHRTTDRDMKMIDPPDLPAYPGWIDVRSHTETGPRGGKNRIWTFRTTDSSEDVFEYYREHFESDYTMEIDEPHRLWLNKKAGCPFYAFLIQKGKTGTEGQEIKITLVQDPCMQYYRYETPLTERAL